MNVFLPHNEISNFIAFLAITFLIPLIVKGFTSKEFKEKYFICCYVIFFGGILLLPFALIGLAVFFSLGGYNFIINNYYIAIWFDFTIYATGGFWMIFSSNWFVAVVTSGY